MKLKASIAIVVLAGLAVVASAQSGPVKGRSFTYSSSDAISQDFSTAGSVTLKSASNVTVDPYLYITGNLSANWVVDGWGVGTLEKLDRTRMEPGFRTATGAAPTPPGWGNQDTGRIALAVIRLL